MQVHLILNSHLDPVWLWRRAQGLDEVLGTARTACDLLDQYPRLIITRGEMWFYENVEKCDPALFERIRRHVATGRWRIVGGWYVQPDCNLTGEHAFAKHHEFGSRYFREKFGVRVKTAYHVDSFGHAGTLPDILRRSGFENYVMMRPSKEEMSLPASTFLWESPAGNRIRTFRISRSYCTPGQDTEKNLRANLDAALADADPAIGHTMCFIGVGNHGGGPARREIEWLDRHLHYRDGVELLYSSPDRYFEAVASSGATLPVVRQELQHHAIGCYTAVGRIKREVRRTELLLHQADSWQTAHPRLFDPGAEEERERGWKKLLFATFHDILPGSAVRSAYEDIYQDLGAARSTAQHQMELAIRRRNTGLPPDLRQRLFFDNPGETEFDGFAEFEPWLGYLWADPGQPRPSVRFTGSDGESVPAQEVTPEAAAPMVRYTARLRIPAGGCLTLFVNREEELPPAGTLHVTPERLDNRILSAAFNLEGVCSLRCKDREYLRAPLRAEVIEDLSDTWSHGLKCYDTAVSERFQPVAPATWAIRRSGPLSGEVARTEQAPSGTLHWNVRLNDGEAALELRLRLSWHGGRKLVKLLLSPAFSPISRCDGAPGGTVPRTCNAEEYPVTGFVSLSAADGDGLTVVSPDVTAADVQPDGTIRLTLLRSPCYAHHDPFPLPADHDYPFTDQGEAEYRIRLLPGPFDPEQVRKTLHQLSEPLWFSESTDGCGNNFR